MWARKIQTAPSKDREIVYRTRGSEIKPFVVLDGFRAQGKRSYALRHF